MTAPPGNFIADFIVEDRTAGKHGGRVATRFPPEPNGYLHIGHAKSIFVNFGLAAQFGGTCNLRFDDTNPTTEDVEYVEAIQADIKWLGYEWTALYYASDYFERIYQVAEKLIEKGVAYVDDLDEETMREYRGNFYVKGKPTPRRDTPPAENLQLFRDMRAGKFKEGQYVLRAKIDLETQNMNLRDPVLYRIRYAPHHRTGTKWCIYPLYDFAHPLSDAFEEITHSICTLEFEAHRPLYDWCIREGEVFPSRQIEFARLALTYTVMSKRRLLELVTKKCVNGWDDPRMPTLAGLRRRGYTAEALRAFSERVGVAKADSIVDVGLLEYCLREDLNRRCPRVMAVLRPLRVVLENIGENETREFEAPLHPEDESYGKRPLQLSRVLYIERDDFREDPPKDWFRLAPGREVRLRYAGIFTCTDVIKDAAGEVVELRGKIDNEPRNVKGTIHWVSAAHAVDAEVRLYDRLFNVEAPGTIEGKSFLDELNPDSLVKLTSCKAEPFVAARPKDERFSRLQFERLGYFCADPDGPMVWNRTVTLKDTWAKIEKKATEKKPEPKAPKPPKKAAEPVAPPAEIGIEEFQKLDLRVGVVESAEIVPEAQKLLKLMVNLGEGRARQIFAGLRAFYPEPGVLVGKRVIVVANLKPRQMKFGLSEGMVLAAGGDDRPHHVATFDDETTRPGDKIS